MRMLLILSLMSLAFCAPAQQKIGHADWEYIFSHMPEYKSIERTLATFETQLQNQLTAKGQELETKYKAYQALPADTPEAIKKDKESELFYLKENMEKFRDEAQASMQKKQAELVNPVLDKVGKAIEAVAAENGFTYIINPRLGGDLLLYADERYNISDLVLQKMTIAVDKTPVPGNQ